MGQLIRRTWYFLRQRQVDADLADEMEFHRAMKQRELEDRGVDPIEATFATRRALGSTALAQDHSRDVWCPGWLQGVGQDIRLAIRILFATRIVSAVAVLSLALGIGANTAIFSLVNSLVFRSLPVRDPDRLVSLVTPGVDHMPTMTRYAVWEQIRQRAQLFDGILAVSSTQFNLAAGGEAHLVDGLWASGSFFDVLGVPTILGRAFSDADDASLPFHGTAEPVAVISYGFWQRHFGGATDVIGRPLALDSIPFTIVGVTPVGFFGPEVGRTFDVVVPLGAEPRIHGPESWIAGSNPNSPLRVMARLKLGQTVNAATAALRGVQPQIREATLPKSWPKAYLDQYLKDAFTLAPSTLVNSNLRRRFERPLLTLMAVVLLVLLVACANIANLQLAGATARRHELAVRRALGASAWRLGRQLLVESAVVGSVGATLGLIVARWGSRALVRGISTDANPVFLDVSLDSRVILFTVVVAAATVVLFGVAPAFRASTLAPIDAMKEDHRASHGARGVGLASTLIVAQVTLALILVVSAGLFVRTFASLAARPLGFNAGRVLIVNVDAQRATNKPAERVPLYARVREAIRHVPGVVETAISVQTPIVTGPMLGQPIASISGRPPLPPRGELSMLNLISDRWFSTLGTQVITGRDVAKDDRKGFPLVAVVNETFARKFLDGADPIGHRVGLFLPSAGPPPQVELVGLVADTVYGSLRKPIPPTIYLPLAQLDDNALPFITSVNLSVRSDQQPPASLITSVAAAVREVNPQLTLTFQTLDDQIDASLTQERLLAILSGSFGSLALLLAALGLYGVTAYAVSRRRIEMGIRMALGATPKRVIWLVLRRVLLLVGCGIIVGGATSLLASRFIATLLYGLEPRDPVTLISAASILVTVAVVAASLPAWRASRIDPSVALRYE